MHKLWLLTFALGLFAAIMLGLPPAVTALGRDYDADVHIFEHMGPEELARLRDTSPQMAKHVDAYVQDLVRSNRLRRGETNSSQQEIETMINRVTPSRLLEDWSHGSLTKR